MTSALRRTLTALPVAKSTNLCSKLKLEDLYQFDNEVRQKLLDKLYPAKSVNRSLFNHFLNQTFIVNGIISDKYKSVHRTHMQFPSAQGCIQRIKARYDTKNTLQRVIHEEETTAPVPPMHRHKRKEAQTFFHNDATSSSRTRKITRQSLVRNDNKIYPSNFEDD